MAQANRLSNLSMLLLGLSIILLVASSFFVGRFSNGAASITVTTTIYLTKTTAITTTVTRTGVKEPLKVGEEAVFKDLRVIVMCSNISKTYIYYSNSIGANITQSAQNGKKFVVIYAIITIDSGRRYAGAAQFSLSDSTMRKYSITPYLGKEALPFTQELNAYDAIVIKGFVLFEVPENATGFYLAYEFGTIYSSNSAVWEIGS